jgi:hypothetical protein
VQALRDEVPKSEARVKKAKRVKQVVIHATLQEDPAKLKVPPDFDFTHHQLPQREQHIRRRLFLHEGACLVRSSHGQLL